MEQMKQLDEEVGLVVRPDLILRAAADDDVMSLFPLFSYQLCLVLIPDLLLLRPGGGSFRQLAADPLSSPSLGRACLLLHETR